MDITDDLTFDEWFDLFQDHCRKKLNYQGPIDKYSFEWNYEDGQTPEFAAKEFVEEMAS